MLIAGWKVELFHAGYAVVRGVADALAATLTINRAAGHPYDNSSVKLKDLYSFLPSAAPGEENLKNAKQRPLRNPFFNHAEGSLHQRDRDHGTGRCSLERRFCLRARNPLETTKMQKSGLSWVYR